MCLQKFALRQNALWAYVSPMLPLADRNPTMRAPVFTVLLIGINIAVFVFWQGGGTFTAAEDSKFTFEHAAVPCELIQGRPATNLEIRAQRCLDHPPSFARAEYPAKNVYLAVLVSMFMHGGWLHLLGNMLFLWIFGNNVEDRLGSALFVAFYLAGGVVATAAQVAFDPNSVVPLIGASGAIAAVMGAYLVWFPRAPILTLLFFFFVEIPAGIWLTIWFVLQFFTGPNSGVAYMAHIGGFAFGIVIAALLRRTDWWRRQPSATQRFAT
jgi:membrane associated rhomboid family serine protease